MLKDIWQDIMQIKQPVQKQDSGLQARDTKDSPEVAVRRKGLGQIKKEGNEIQYRQKEKGLNISYII